MNTPRSCGGLSLATVSIDLKNLGNTKTLMISWLVFWSIEAAFNALTGNVTMYVEMRKINQSSFRNAWLGTLWLTSKRCWYYFQSTFLAPLADFCSITTLFYFTTPKSLLPGLKSRQSDTELPSRPMYGQMMVYSFGNIAIFICTRQEFIIRYTHMHDDDSVIEQLQNSHAILLLQYMQYISDIRVEQGIEQRWISLAV